MVGKEDEKLDKIMDVQPADEREQPKEPPREEPIKKFALAPKYAPQPEKREAPGNLPLLLAVLAVAISLLALGLALFYHPSAQAVPSAELKAIAEDLKGIRDSGMGFEGPVSTVTELNAEIPASEAMGETLQVPIEMEIPISGKVSGTSPWGGVVQFPVSGTIPVKMTVDMGIGNTSQAIRIKTSVPSNTTAKFALNPSEEWKQKLDDIIQRLEKTAG